MNTATITPPKLSRLGRAALAYAERFGWRVHPLRPGDKRPLTAHGFKDASTDLEQIRAWWEQTPDANIGIATGKDSGVSVLDVDVKDGAAGELTLRGLLEQHDADLTEHVCQRTWSGGLQYVFAYDPRARQGAGCYGPGLDGRNDGGYIVAPPSVVNGATYEWIVKPGSPLAVPAWLIEAADTLKPSQAEGERKNPPGWADELMMAGSTKGERDHQAHRLIQHARESGKSEADCWARLTTFGGNCVPPFDPKTDKNIAAKIRKAYARAPVFEGNVPKAVVRERQTPATAMAPEGPSLETVAAAQHRIGQHTDWLVDRMLAVGDMSVLVAKPGLGKSTFAAELAVAVAYGRPFLGRQTRQGLVVYLAFEGARSTMEHMVRMGHDPESPAILMWRSDADTQDPAAWLDTVLKDVTPALIVVDTLADFARVRHGSANAGYEEMVAKLGAVYVWAQARRAHIHLLHHAAKGDRDGIDAALGTIGIVSKPGTVLDYRPMSKAEDAPRVLKGLKHREGDKETDLPALVLDFDRDRGLSVAGYRDEVSVRELGVAMVRIVVRTPDVKQAEVLDEVEGRKATKLEALRLLTDPTDGVLVREGTAGSRVFPLRLKVRPDLEGDPVELWRRPESRFPGLRVGSHSPEPTQIPAWIEQNRVGSHHIPKHGNLLNQNETSDAVGSPTHIERPPSPSPEWDAAVARARQRGKLADSGGHAIPESKSP